MNLSTFLPELAPATPRSTAALMRVAGCVASVAVIGLAGCTLEPPGPSPIYSRLPPDQSGVAATAHPLTEQERKQYDAIDRQVLADQNQQMAWDAAAQAWSRYYAQPVTVYGGYGGYYGGGWGSGWTTGVGVGYGPMWGW